MNRIRYLAAGLLCVTGIIHVARLGIPQLDAAFVTTAVIFGVGYLIIGVFLFRNNKRQLIALGQSCLLSASAVAWWEC